MKKITLLLSAFIFVAGLFLNQTQITEACSVTAEWPPNGFENFVDHSVVFIGTVTEADRDEDINGNIYVRFEKEKWYKGYDNGSSIIEVTFPGNSALCGYDDVNMFEKDSVWAIYATEGMESNFISNNKKYDSVDDAISEVDDFENYEAPITCTQEYDPVCGVVDTGIRCVTTPCPSSAEKTFSNKCFLNVEGAEFLHNGECKPEKSNPTPVMPDDCRSWYDGCNWCSRDKVGGPAMCTLRACLSDQAEKAYCAERFVKNDIGPFTHDDNRQIEEEFDVPLNCKSWYNGCNWCYRETSEDKGICALGLCMGEEYEVAHCADYFIEEIRDNGDYSPSDYSRNNTSNNNSEKNNKGDDDYRGGGIVEVDNLFPTTNYVDEQPGENLGIWQRFGRAVVGFFSTIFSQF